jgi:HD-like signal output (HDOD) protein
MLEDVITMESLLEKGPELSSLPEVYLRVTQLLEDDDVSAHVIGDTVQNDPALSTRILKMVNSAYYGMPHKVSTISQAVQLLGRDRLKQILIGSVLVNVFRDPEIDSFSLADFWRHSIKTAIIAKQLAIQHVDISEPDAIFIAGLLHDLGRLLLASKLPAVYEKIEGRMRNQDLLEIERQALGFDHAELAATLMTQWGLPDILVICTRHHHDSEYADTYATANRVIYVANKLSRNIPPMDEDEAQEQLAKIDNWQLLGLPLDQISFACQLADEQMFDVMESLGMINIELEAD